MGSGHGFDRELLRLLRHRYGQSSRDDLIDLKRKSEGCCRHSQQQLSRSRCLQLLNLLTRGQCPFLRATLTGGLNPADPLAGELDYSYLLRRRALLRSIASRARRSSAPQLPVLARRRSARRVRSERFASRRSALAIFCRRLWFGSGTTYKSPQIRKDGAYASCGCFGRDTGSIGATIENRLMTRAYQMLLPTMDFLSIFYHRLHDPGVG